MGGTRTSWLDWEVNPPTLPKLSQPTTVSYLEDDKV